MARGKKTEEALTPEEKLAQALVPAEEQPYPLPENWCWFRLSALARVISKGTTPSGGKGNSLDLGLIRDDSIVDYEDLPDPVESGEEAIAQLEEAVDLLMSVLLELKSLESSEV